MAHKDLSERYREELEAKAWGMAHELFYEGQSLALAREAWLTAFDKAAEELDEVERRAQADRDYYDQRTAAQETLMQIDGPLDGGDNGEA